MKAIILAGGYAKRLGSLAENLAKPLLPLGGRRIIDYIIDKVEELPNIDETIIFTNEKFRQQFEEWLRKRKSPKKIRVVAEPSSHEEEKLGAIKALAWLFSTYESIRDDCLILAGDNLFTSSLKPFIDYYYEKKSSPIVAVYSLDKPELVKYFSAVRLDSNGLIVDFREKPKEALSTLVGTGIYLLPKETLNLLEDYLAEDSNYDSPGHFISWLCKRMKVYGYRLEGYWIDVGTPEAYQEAMKNEKAKF